MNVFYGDALDTDGGFVLAARIDSDHHHHHHHHYHHHRHFISMCVSVTAGSTPSPLLHINIKIHSDGITTDSGDGPQLQLKLIQAIISTANNPPIFINLSQDPVCGLQSKRILR